MPVTFIQTADAFNYKPMLDVTSKTVIEYCRRHSHAYESFVGIKRGFYPWQASFNRLFMLKEMADAGHRGWIAYLDADAFIYDLTFDLDSYLLDKSDCAGVLTPVGVGVHWDINNGVMFLNLSHPVARRVIDRWHARYMAVGDERLRALVNWPGDINDQRFLFEILDADEEAREAFFYEERRLLNDAEGLFIRQILRAYMPAQSDRLHVVRTAVDEILPDGSDDIVDRLYPIMISNLFRVLLRRDIEESAVNHFRARFVEKGIDTAFRETFAEILVSREYRELNTEINDELLVRLAYRCILGREPDDIGGRAYVNALRSGTLTFDKIRSDMLGSAEFASKYPTAVTSLVAA